MSTANGPTHDFFGADNDVSKLCRQLDWSATTLGPPRTWSDTLKTTARMVLESRFPMALGWGDDFTQIYNDGFVPILGDKHPRALGRPFSQAYPELWEQTGPLLRGVYAQGESQGFEDRFFLIERKGFLEESYFTFSYSPVRNGDGAIVGLLVTSHETTAHVLARRRAETLSRIGSPTRQPSIAGVLQQTLAHLESDERDIPWCVAVETRAALEQRQLVATFGLRADKEELGSSLLDPLPDITAQDDAPVTLRTPIRHRETTGERPPASRAVWLPIYADPELSSREVGGLIMGLSDHLAYDEPYQLFIESIRRSVSAAIQHRIYRDTELTNAERRYSAVFENALDAIMLTSPSDEILHANAAACELLGYTEHELRQLGRKDIIDPEDGRLEAAVSVRASTGEFRGELGLKHRDGHIIPCELSSKLYHDAEGKPRTSVVFRDMRERLQLEAKLRQSQKLEVIGKLAGGVAHDFNNLLTAIDASAQFLEQSIEPGTEAAEDVSVIRSASDRAAGLTQRLLAFSRKGTDESTVLEPEGLVTGISSILRSLLGEGIELVLQLDSDLHPIRASRQRLEQLLLNLLVNAHDAMPDGGSIRIEVTNRELESEPDDLVIGTTSPGEYVQISVIDSGEGLPPNQHTRLFEPFYTTKKHGTGLGLATVAEVVRDCAGAILVQSERDVCTRFDILLPATHDLPDESDNGEFAAPTIGPLSGRVLLIEDQPRVRKVTRRMLECAGLEVATASGGPDAIALVEHAEPQRFDLVISDIVMPKMSGVQTVRHLRNIDSNLKFLFISGYPNRENLHLSTENPIPLIRKPFTSTELLAAVEELVA